MFKLSTFSSVQTFELSDFQDYLIEKFELQTFKLSNFQKLRTCHLESLAAAKKAKAKVGQPYLEGATVKADVLDEIKGNKVDVIKFKRRKGYKRKQGHRQGYLRVRVSKITAAKA